MVFSFCFCCQNWFLGVELKSIFCFIQPISQKQTPQWQTPPFCGMKFLHSNSPQKMANLTTPNVSTTKNTSTTKRKQHRPRRWSKWCTGGQAGGATMGNLRWFWATWRGVEILRPVPKEICSTFFPLRDAKKTLGISCIRNYFSVFRCIFAWFVFIIVWLERFRISMKHCQGKDVFQILVDLYTQFESFPVKLNRVFHRFNKVSLHVSPMRSHHSYHPGWKGWNFWTQLEAPGNFAQLHHAWQGEMAYQNFPYERL